MLDWLCCFDARTQHTAEIRELLGAGHTFTDRVTAESAGTAYPAITEGRLGSFYVLIPPLSEQTAIAEYLETQTAKIDAAIATDQRAIELLGEFRTSLIADAVTGMEDVREVAARLPEEPDEEDAPWMDDEERAQGETLNAEDDHAAISEENE